MQGRERRSRRGPGRGCLGRGGRGSRQGCAHNKGSPTHTATRDGSLATSTNDQNDKANEGSTPPTINDDAGGLMSSTTVRDPTAAIARNAEQVRDTESPQDHHASTQAPQGVDNTASDHDASSSSPSGDENTSSSPSYGTVKQIDSPSKEAVTAPQRDNLSSGSLARSPHN